MYNFKVKSSIQDYTVEFVEDFSQSLKNEISDGDIILIDENVLNLYRSKIEHLLATTNYITISATEEQKSYLGIVPIIEKIIELNFRKNNKLIAIGGGITQDITAFISSIMYRGVSWLFFPTTLLAQGDSCIGGKTSINFGMIKNQIGNFCPPQKIFIDLDFLKTLSANDIWSGLGEMCHYFIISGEEDFLRFRSDFKIARENNAVLEGLISRSLEIKKRMIEIDEFDKKERQVFNYGHSFGHAIESLTNFKVPHGIAVSIGMDMANFISYKKGYIKSEIRTEIKEVLEQIWEGFSIENISVDKFKSALSKDKKNTGNKLGLILSKGIGKTFKDSLFMDEKFENWLQEYFVNEMK